MSDFQDVRGFEEVWRAPVRPRFQGAASASRLSTPQGRRARLARIVGRAPEVMVKVTGRTRSGAHLRAHLDYISRNGDLNLETQDGARLASREDVRELAADWSAEQLADRRTRADAPFSLGLVLSMPAGTDPTRLRDAARAFAAQVFAEQYDYVFALHTDTPRPHVHLTIAARGHSGERLNPKKADLDLWRQVFAEKLRARGIEAEATPRRARGVVRKPERTAIRKIQDRHAAGHGPVADVRRSAYLDAVGAAFLGDSAPRAWELQAFRRQQLTRRLYLEEAKALGGSADPQDRALAAQVADFVASMPEPASQRLELARELRAARREEQRSRQRDGVERGRER